MPAVTRYIPPDDPERNVFSDLASTERENRRDTYLQSIKYYEGSHDQMLDFDPRQGDEVNDNVVYNMVKMTCERTVSFLFSQVPIVQTDKASVEDTEEEMWIKRFIEHNGGLYMLTKLATRGFLSGHSFVSVSPPKASSKGYPKINILDPLSMTIYWNAEDEDEVVWYEQRILVGDEVHIYDYVHNLENDQWGVMHYSSPLGERANFAEEVVETLSTKFYTNYTKRIDKIDFAKQSFTLVKAEMYPNVGIPPIIEIPHLPNPIDRYGLEEFTMKDLQDTINLMGSLRNQVAREVGVPVDVAIGADADEIENAGDLIVISNPNAKLQRLELRGDIGGVTSMLDKLMETYLSIARVVILKGEAKDLQRVTNASVRTLFLDMIAKNNILKDTYGRGLRKVVELAMRMSGEAWANNETDVTVEFASALPTDYTELANINAIMANLGARSLQTSATIMGDHWAFERQAIANENADKLEQQRQQKELEAEFAERRMNAMSEQQTQQTQQTQQQQDANSQSNSNNN